MSDKDNSKNGLIAFLKQVWGGITGIVGVASIILGYIKLADDNSGLLTLILLAVGIGCSYLSCLYYLFFWQPKSMNRSSSLILSGSNQPRKFQETKHKQRKKARILALLGLFIITISVLSGFGFYQYQAQLPPKDFKILVANFESSDSSNLNVTTEIFNNLEREMEKYGEDVKVKRLEEPLKSIQEAKQIGREQKAAIVIWGDYQVIKEVVPIRVNFEIMHEFESTDYFKLGKSVLGETQTAQISELESFELQTNLSQEMTYLSLFTLGMYRYLDGDWQQAIHYLERALAVAQETDKAIASLRTDVADFYILSSFLHLKNYYSYYGYGRTQRSN